MLWKDLNNKVHDDMGGEALYLPSWPQNMIQITQQEADALRALTPAQLLEQKAAVLKTFVSIRATMISVLSVIAGKKGRAGHSPDAQACDAACTSLQEIESNPAIIAATDGATTKAAILSAYQIIAATLNVSSPSSAAEFVAIGLTYP